MIGLRILKNNVMGYEKEYIDIFDNNRQLIDNSCADLLNAKRLQAFGKFKAAGFPDKKNEKYLHTDVAKMFATDFGMNLGRVPVGINPQDFFTCDVPNLKTHVMFMANDTCCTAEQPCNNLPEGVILGSLNELCKKHKEIFAPYYNTLACDGDGVSQFNTSFVQDGIALYIPSGVEIEETIQMVMILHSNIEQLSNRRLLIILGDNAKANILICDHASNDKKTLSTLVTEVFLGEGATLNIFEIEETGYNNGRIAQLFVKQESNSNLNHSNITLTNGLTHNSTTATLNGKGATANLSGLAICDREQHVANSTLVDHKVSHCTSNELYKYILDEQSKGVFAGKMLIRPDAQQTLSQQTNRNLCLTSCARMYSQPQLEIYADDVKCSHGSSTGQLDNNAMFYMQQRGIPKEEARHLLMFAFAGEVIEKVTIAPLRDRLHMLVEKRFRGELNRCKGCSLCKK